LSRYSSIGTPVIVDGLRWHPLIANPAKCRHRQQVRDRVLSSLIEFFLSVFVLAPVEPDGVRCQLVSQTTLCIDGHHRDERHFVIEHPSFMQWPPAFRCCHGRSSSNLNEQQPAGREGGRKSLSKNILVSLNRATGLTMLPKISESGVLVSRIRGSAFESLWNLL
jgi:hypothetical protein